MKRLVYTWPIPEVQAAGVWLNQKHQFSSSSFRNIISTSIIYILCVFPTNWSSEETFASITRGSSVMFSCCFIATNGTCWKKWIRIYNGSELTSFSYLQFPGARIVELGLGFPCGTGVRVIVPGSGSSNWLGSEIYFILGPEIGKNHTMCTNMKLKVKVKNYLAHGLFGRQFEDLILKKKIMKPVHHKYKLLYII